MRSFRSDNNAGLTSEALAAITVANDGSHHTGYGDDDYSTKAVEAFERLFGPDIAVFFVATGTAANTLAIASLTEPWQQVICHAFSHWNEDESTAPERLTHCRTTPIDTDEAALTVDDLHRAMSGHRGDVHQPQPGILTLSNPTEFGTVYSPDALRALCDVAHEHGYRVHIDGARFANAVAAVGCDPKALTIDAGVDAMSFGGTKNGLAFGEAVVFFRRDDAVFTRATAALPFHRKGTGHLLSKHRFVAAPFAATLRDGSWLKHAQHANAMATRLSDGLRTMNIGPRFAVQTNGVFVSLPRDVDARLRKAGHGYYPFGRASWGVSRLMCSFDTTPEDVDALLRDARGDG